MSVTGATKTAPRKAGKRPKALPLDGPNWMPLLDVCRTLCSVTGARQLAEIDLRQALHDGLPYLRRDLRSGEREIGKREFWDTHPLSLGPNIALRVSGPYYEPSAFFCWRPALAKRWPHVAAFARAKQAEPAPSSAPSAQPPKKVSDAALLKCLRAIVKEHAEQRPDELPLTEERLHEEMERRLGAPLERDRVRDVRDEHAPEFKRPIGRPRKG